MKLILYVKCLEALAPENEEKAGLSYCPSGEGNAPLRGYVQVIIDTDDTAVDYRGGGEYTFAPHSKDKHSAKE